MVEIKNTETEIWEAHQQTWYDWEKDQWAWINVSRNIYNWNIKKKKKIKKLNEISKNHRTTTKCTTYVNRNTRSRRKKGTKETFEVIIAEYFPKLMTGTKLKIQEAQ